MKAIFEKQRIARSGKILFKMTFPIDDVSSLGDLRRRMRKHYGARLLSKYDEAPYFGTAFLPPAASLLYNTAEDWQDIYYLKELKED